MQPYRLLIVLIVSLIFSFENFAGGNSKIVLDDFLAQNRDSVNARTMLKQGESMFKKGREKHALALEFFMNAYKANENYDPLNYRIAVCYLSTNNKAGALPYIQSCSPTVADDYQLILARALHYNLKFSAAIEAYELYLAGLKSSDRKKIAPKINKLIDECRNGNNMVTDSQMFEIKPLVAVNSKYDEFNPFFAFDDSTFFVSTNRKSKRKINEDFLTIPLQKLYSDTVQPLAEPGKRINSKVNNVALSYNRDTRQLLIYDGKTGKGDIFITEKNKSGQLKQPKPLSSKINTKSKEATAVFVNKRTLVFSSDRKGGFGGMDLYVSFIDDKGRWSKPVNLGGTINTSYDEEVCGIGDDDETLYFTTRGLNSMGGVDIFSTKISSTGLWGNPVNLNYPINTPDDDIGFIDLGDNRFIVAACRPEGVGGIDIFRLNYLFPEVIVDTHFSIKGKISDAQSRNAIADASVQIYNVFSDSVIANVKSDADGFFYKWFPDKYSVGFSVIADGYLPVKKLFEQEIGEDTLYFVEIEMTKRPVEARYDFTLLGQIKNKNTGVPVNAMINVFKGATDSLIARLSSDSVTGKYMLNLDDIRKPYYFKLAAQGFNEFDELIIFGASDSLRTVVRNFDLNPLAKKESLTLTGIVSDATTQLPVKAKIKFINAATQNEMLVETDSLSGKYQVVFGDRNSAHYVNISANGYKQSDVMVAFNPAEDEKVIVRNFKVTPQPKPESLVFTGIISDEATKMPLPAEIKFVNPVNQTEQIVYSDSVTGKYYFKSDVRTSMIAEIRKEGYFFVYEVIPSPQISTDNIAYKDFKIKAIKKGERLVLNNILFETGKAILTKSSYSELDKLVKMMSNSDVRVEISGHTDNTGGYELNKKLSESRAKAVVDYLISSGINKDRLTYKGYGPDEPIAPNTSADGRAKNRRVEMKIID
jgi:outer membrane protein OmpA-like peptidoglycan-associated protein